MPDRERILGEIDDILTRARQLRDELAAEPDGDTDTDENEAAPPRESARQRAMRRWGLSAAIGLLGAIAWMLTRTHAQIAATAGMVAAVGTVVTVTLLPGRDRIYDAQPTPGPTGVSTPAHIPSTVSTLPPVTEANTASRGRSGSTTSEPTPGPAIPVQRSSSDALSSTSAEQGSGQREPVDGRDGGEGQDDRARKDDDTSKADNGRARCLTVAPNPEVALRACLRATVAVTVG